MEEGSYSILTQADDPSSKRFLAQCGNLVEPVRGYSPSATLAKKLLSEFLGSFLLIVAAMGSAVADDASGGAVTLNGVAAAPAAMVAAMILSTGHISGAHINPAVTLAFATFRHFPWIQVPLYIAVQLLASVAGAFTIKAAFSPNYGALGVTLPASGCVQSLLIEVMLTFALMFVVTSVSTDTRAVGEMAGIAVGAVVYLDVMIGAKLSGASMNPVRTLGPAIVSGNYTGLWIYFVGPILGAQLGAAAYTLIRFQDLERQQRRKLLI